jgi:hypothetical protein
MADVLTSKIKEIIQNHLKYLQCSPWWRILMEHINKFGEVITGMSLMHRGEVDCALINEFKN